MSSGQVSLDNATAPDMTHDLASPPSDVDASHPKTPPQNTSNLSPPVNTPHNCKQSGTQPYTSTYISIKADARNTALAAETVGHVVGHMPVKKFLELYVPKAGEDVRFVQAKADEMQSRFKKIIAKGESGMYQEWVRVPFCPFH